MTLKTSLSASSVSPALYGRTAVQERMTAWLVARLQRMDAQPAASALLRMARLRLEGRPVTLAELPVANPGLPEGPFHTPDAGRGCSLLAFPPAGLADRLVDQATGGYGYAWLAVDLGEVDAPTGQRVMLELPFFASPRRVYLDRYGDHPYARISLADAGVDCREFAARLAANLKAAGAARAAGIRTWTIAQHGQLEQDRSLVTGSNRYLVATAPPRAPFRARGEKPEKRAAQTRLDLPVWTMSADVAPRFSSRVLTASLPAELLAAILSERQAGLLSQAAGVENGSGRQKNKPRQKNRPRQKNKPRGKSKPRRKNMPPENSYVSPNAFCEYFGAPRGADLVGPGQRVYPARGLQRTYRAGQILGGRRRRKALLGLSMAGGLLLSGVLAGQKLRTGRRPPRGGQGVEDPGAGEGDF